MGVWVVEDETIDCFAKGRLFWQGKTGVSKAVRVVHAHNRLGEVKR